jgi:glutaconyl-CoA/methylmalonyl-CoA decarboxylase subunit delta
MNMELAIDTLAVIGAATCLWLAMRLVAAFLGWVERSEIARQAAEAEAERAATAPGAPAAPREVRPAVGGIPPEHVAAIAAAVAMMGSARVVLIEDNATGQAWATEGRWQHQTSHRPH